MGLGDDKWVNIGDISIKGGNYVADKSFSNIEERRQIIYNTYQNAVNSGDKNVYFIDGQTMYENVGHDLCTVDNCHPNDLGFWCMANSIGNVLDDILNK